MTKEIYSQEDLIQFKNLQHLAYQTVQLVQAELRVGMTEIEAAGLIEAKLKSNGITQYFHRGFAWFGDRTRFKNFSMPLDFKSDKNIEENGFLQKLKRFSPQVPLPHFGLEFMPSKRKLTPGMPVILDVAPVQNRLAADIGYSFSFGENLEVHQGIMNLKPFRSMILEMVQAEKGLSEIYHSCDQYILDIGYENCHEIYPLGVLGHRIGRLPLNFLPKISLMGFPPQAFAFLTGHLGKSLFNGMANKSPFWTSKNKNNAEVGLWAIEPHIGKGDVGVKFEEILVIDESKAYWLDDDLPHVKYWNTQE